MAIVIFPRVEMGSDFYYMYIKVKVIFPVACLIEVATKTGFTINFLYHFTLNTSTTNNNQWMRFSNGYIKL